MSPAAVVWSGGRKISLVDHALVPDIAPEKYATLGWVLFGGRGAEEQRRRLHSRR